MAGKSKLLIAGSVLSDPRIPETFLTSPCTVDLRENVESLFGRRFRVSVVAFLPQTWSAFNATFSSSLHGHRISLRARIHGDLSWTRLSAYRYSRRCGCISTSEGMAPKLSTNDGIVLNYVNEQNRPLNVQNVADGLQKHGIKKTAVEKILASLGDNGVISFKEYGKQRIYLARQDQFQIPNAEELDRMRKENEQLQREISAAKTANGDLETELRSVKSNLTDSQIKQETEKLNTEIPVLEAKLNTLKSGATLVKPDDREKIEMAFTLKTNLWRKRKRMFKDLWDMITEAMPNNLAEFREELGIETDEDAGVKIDDYCNLVVRKPVFAKRLKR
ncbi:hypothetical protein R1flu_011722 [Riccia fluitans]|uniref:Homologous-pairing protein 2 homolog n=1 Tax=Riccia fluitans TaxID=41844 RepID=A0ABD1Z9H8_9MARC